MTTQIIDIVAANAPVTARKVAKLMGLPDEQVRAELKSLVEQGALAKVTENKSALYLVPEPVVKPLTDYVVKPIVDVLAQFPDNTPAKDAADTLQAAAADVVPDPKPEAAVAAVKPTYVLRVGQDDYLRRDQPRKPGDTATYKIVGITQASFYKRREQAEIKVVEATQFNPAWTVEVVAL